MLGTVYWTAFSTDVIGENGVAFRDDGMRMFCGWKLVGPLLSLIKMLTDYGLAVGVSVPSLALCFSLSW